MPEKQKVDTKPSSSLLRKLFGGPMSESTQQEWPELARAWASKEIAMPSEAMKVSSVKPMNRFDRFLTGGATAYVNPITGIMKINRGNVTEDENLNEVLIHELTHMGQNPGFLSRFKSLYTPWEKRPEEIEAMEAEMKYRRPRDIELLVDTGPSKKVKNAAK